MSIMLELNQDEAHLAYQAVSDWINHSPAKDSSEERELRREDKKIMREIARKLSKSLKSTKQ